MKRRTFIQTMAAASAVSVAPFALGEVVTDPVVKRFERIFSARSPERLTSIQCIHEAVRWHRTVRDGLKGKRWAVYRGLIVKADDSIKTPWSVLTCFDVTIEPAPGEVSNVCINGIYPQREYNFRETIVSGVS